MDKKKMEEIGIDVTGALDRFMGNEMLYIKFLKKFLDDENYNELRESLERNSAQEAFRYAHTLKGLGANLGMSRLYEILSPMVEILRTGTTQNTGEYMEQVTLEYDKITDFIRGM